MVFICDNRILAETVILQFFTCILYLTMFEVKLRVVEAWKVEAVRPLWVSGQPSVHIEFQSSQNYIVKLHLKI